MGTSRIPTTTTAPTAEQEWTVNDMQVIDKEVLVDRLAELADLNREWKPEFTEFCEEMICMVEDMPYWNDTDFREGVVRCKDCERRAKSADLTDSVYCPWLKLQMRKTDFCSYGERKETNHEH